MDAIICPLALEWGDVATWSSALFALFVGIAVYRLGSKTHQLEIAVIEGSSRQRVQERRALMTAMIPELEANSAFLKNMASLALTDHFSSLAANGLEPASRFWIYAQALKFRHYDRFLSRAHLFLPQHAGALARAYTFMQVLQDLDGARGTASIADIEEGIRDVGPRLLSLAQGIDQVSQAAQEILSEIENVSNSDSR